MTAPSSFIVDYSHQRYAVLQTHGADLIIYESGLTLDWPPAPAYLDPTELAALGAAGKQVIGYVNVAVTDDERSYWDDTWVNYSSSAERDWGPVTDDAPAWLKNNRGGIDFFAGHPGPDGYVVDYTDAAWQAIVIDYAETIVSAGYHGVFLDDVGQYFQAGWHGGSYDPSWAVAMIEFVIDISDAVHAINPDAYVAVNSGINIGFDSFIDLNGSLWADYLGAVDAVLLENQFANEGPGGGQDALSDAVARFQNETILSVETYGNPIDLGGWLQFCGDNDILPYMPNSDLYTQFTRAPELGTAGRDVIKLAQAGIVGGLEGVDILKGSNGNDIMFGHGGADRMLGKAGRDVMAGGDAGDYLFGDYGADFLYGEKGSDTIEGGRGNDRLTGDQGRDTFLFRAGDGSDRIEDFASGIDSIEIHSGATSVADITFEERGQGLRLSFDDVKVLLVGLDMGDIAASDFVFA